MAAAQTKAIRRVIPRVTPLSAADKPGSPDGQARQRRGIIWRPGTQNLATADGAKISDQKPVAIRVTSTACRSRAKEGLRRRANRR